MGSASIGGRRRPQPTSTQYTIGGVTAAATGALSGGLRVISDYVVSKGATSLSLAAVGNAAFASGGVALGIFALYSIGSYAVSQMSERERMVFMPDPSRVYHITHNGARYLETIPVIYGRHIVYPMSVTTSTIDTQAWSNYNPFDIASRVNDVSQRVATRSVLCVGSGEYDIPIDSIRVGENPLTKSNFMAADTGMLLTPASVNVVGPGEIFSQDELTAVSGTNVLGFQGKPLNPFTVLSSAGVGSLDGNSGRSLFRSLSRTFGTNGSGRDSIAQPIIAPISLPGDVVQRVSVSVATSKDGRQMTVSQLSNVRNAGFSNPETLVSDYLLTGVFIQARSDGTLINEDGTPVPVANANGELVATGGLFPRDITSITGAVAWQHSTTENQNRFLPNMQARTDAFSQQVDFAGFRYIGVTNNNIGFVYLDRRTFQNGGINDERKRELRYTLTSANLPALGDSTLVPRADRIWMLMMIPYHIMHTNRTSGNAKALRDSVTAQFSIAQVSVQKTSINTNPYYNSGLRNVSDYTFLQAKVPGQDVFDNLRNLVQNAETNKINAIVSRKIRVYRNGIWTSSIELTRSPIWAIADIFTSSVGGKLDPDLNLIGSEMEELANYYESQELYYDEVIDAPQGILDVINNIGSLYDFMVYQHGSRWRLTRDFYAHSIGYLIYESDCIDNIDATYQATQENIDNLLDISYLEGTTWLKTSLVVPADYYTPGVDPENVSQFQLRGLTDIDAIRRFARSKLLKSRYRRQVLNVTLREIGMILKPNDTIGLVHSYFTEEYSYGQVISSERIGGVDFLTTDTDTDITGVGRILFRNEDGTPSHQLHAERVSPHRFRIDHDLELVDLITDPTRVRTSYTFAAPNKPLYNRCKVMAVAPNGVLSYNVTMLIDMQEAYISE